MREKDLTLLQPYCEDDMRLLKRISRRILTGFRETIPQSDYDDFYSVANLTLWKAYNAFDPDMGISFEGFLYSCLRKKFKSELTRRHRDKRVLNYLAVSMDASMGEKGENTLTDVIASDSDTFEEAMEKMGMGRYRDKTREYISRLSKRQINILNLMMDGYKPCEIREALGISPREYSDHLEAIRSYENVRVLY